jgi:hypothetical protein
MKGFGYLVLVLAAALLAAGCGGEDDIAGSGNDSTYVLLSHAFEIAVNPDVWTVYYSEQFAEAYISDGVFYVESGPYPGGYTEIGYLISKEPWAVGESDEYLVTMKCSACGCSGYVGNLIGLMCNGDDFYSADFLGMGFWGADYGTGEEIWNEITGEMIPYSTEYELSPHCEGFHEYVFRISNDHFSMRVDDELIYEVVDTVDDPFLIERFMVLALASSNFHNHCIGVDRIRVERFK